MARTTQCYSGWKAGQAVCIHGTDHQSPHVGLVLYEYAGAKLGDPMHGKSSI